MSTAPTNPNFLKDLGALASDQSITNVILDSMDEAVYVRGPGRDLLYINTAAERLTGWSADDALKRPCFEIFGDRGAKCNSECPIDRANGLHEPLIHSEGSIVDREGNEKQVEVSISPIRRLGKVIATVVVLRDITNLRDLEQSKLKALMQLELAHQELKYSELRFREFAELSSDWWWETDADHRFTFIGGPNAAVRQHLLGRRRHEVADTGLAPEAWALLQKCLDDRSLFRDFAYPQDLKNGKRRWVKISGNPIFEETGEFLGYRGVGTDITASVTENESLRASAERDVLTGLLNRRGFEQALETCQFERRGRSGQFGIAIIDLDRFKVVNDRYGHLVGDKVLVAQADRLTNAVRDSDLVARLGGDEFAILFRGLNDVEGAKRIASKICTRLQQPVPIDDDESVETGASVGLSLFPAHDAEIQAIIGAADQAMYSAKRSGRNRYVIAACEETDDFILAK